MRYIIEIIIIENLHKRNALYYLMFYDQTEFNGIFVLFYIFVYFLKVFQLFNPIITHVVHFMLIMLCLNYNVRMYSLTNWS